MTARLLTGDVRDMLRTLDAESVQCVITSPPYFALRDYGTATWDGGDPACDHLLPSRVDAVAAVATSGLEGGKKSTGHLQEASYRDLCGKCGARRIDRQIGLEPTVAEYVQTMVDVFREVRRVLRPDGVVWLNLGDSYNAYNGNRGDSTGVQKNSQAPIPDLPTGYGLSDASLKPKDLIGIPWRVAFALQEDGWWLRSDIIWHKLNPMPESVRDRPTRAHEYLFLLTKSARYYYDSEAIAEPNSEDMLRRAAAGHTRGPNGKLDASRCDAHTLRGDAAKSILATGRNRRTVWTIATQSWQGSHFATFPEALVEPCILAGSSERGCCSECGAPWRRVVEQVGERSNGGLRKHADAPGAVLSATSAFRGAPTPITQTTGWEPTCTHDAAPVPCTILDPFSGSGSTGIVALRHGRNYVGIDLNPEYNEMARKRITADAPLFNRVTVDTPTPSAATGARRQEDER